jgi:hypothetical protein
VKLSTIVITPKAIVDLESVEDAIDEGINDYKKGRTTRVFSSVKEFKTTLKKK